MDITKCIPGIRLSDMSLRDPSEKQTTPTPSKFSPEGVIG